MVVSRELVSIVVQLQWALITAVARDRR